MYKEAMEEYDKIPKNAYEFIDNLELMRAYGYAITGDSVKAKELFAHAMKTDKAAAPYRAAEVCVALGDVDRALSYLEEGYRIRALHMFFTNVEPAFDPIRNDPRFIALLKKLGFQ
jgi:tetratricopeptide (TPR) repeat protein